MFELNTADPLLCLNLKDNEVNEDGPNATVAFTTGEDVVPQENDQVRLQDCHCICRVSFNAHSSVGCRRLAQSDRNGEGQ